MDRPGDERQRLVQQPDRSRRVPFANNNEWAASIGGPIKKDKLFFFVNTEGIRFILPANGSVFAWTPAFANATLANIAAVDPASLPTYQKYFQIMQSAPGYATNNFAPWHHVGTGDGGCDVPGFNGPAPDRWATASTVSGQRQPAGQRVDPERQALTTTCRTRTTSSGAYAWITARSRPRSTSINPAFAANSFQPSYDGQGQWNHVFSPNATNQFIYAGSYYRAIFTQQDPAAVPVRMCSVMAST